MLKQYKYKHSPLTLPSFLSSPDVIPLQSRSVLTCIPSVGMSLYPVVVAAMLAMSSSA